MGACCRNGKKGFTGDGRSAKTATFNGPKGIAVGPRGNVYVVDTENHAIRKIELKSGLISTVAGSGPEHRGDGNKKDDVGDGRPATSARLDRPHGICVGADGVVYIGDTVNHRVRRVRFSKTLDLNDQAARQVVVDREAGQYLGHPTTCLLEDGQTLLCVYPKGHGRGGIVYKRSNDGGKTWSKRLPTPANWATSKEVPTLHRVIGPDGKKRIIMWSGLYPARLAVTEDDGQTWSALKPVGDWGGIVVMGFVEPLRTGKGHYLAMFHDDGRFFTKGGKRTPEFKLFKTISQDGGLTWSQPEVVFQSAEVNLCEPGCIRSPDGKRMAVLLRENARRKNSHVIFSDDEGATWTQPRETSLPLTGDRHTGKYGPDGRLLISFRCISPTAKRAGRPFEGDWVAWVGKWDDLVNGGDGQYMVRLKHNTKGYDTAYPGVEILPDGTFVATTYGHWDKGQEPYILSVRLTLKELDALAKKSRNR